MQSSEREAQRTSPTRLSICPPWVSKAKASNRENLWCRHQVDLLGVTSHTALLHLCLRLQSPTERTCPLDTEKILTQNNVPCHLRLAPKSTKIRLGSHQTQTINTRKHPTGRVTASLFHPQYPLTLPIEQ